MNILWILVCDAARGRLFEASVGHRAWKLVEVFTHPESRSKTSELISDHSGQRSPEGASAHHNAMAPHSSPKEVEKEHFVHSLVKMLDQGLRTQRFHRLVLVAPPHVLGMMKKELTPELGKHLFASVDKDLTSMNESQLIERLAETLIVPPDQQA